MAGNNGSHGGTHEQHVKAGEQSHKNTGSDSSSSNSDNQTEEGQGMRGGSHEQHVKAGQQSHKNG